MADFDERAIRSPGQPTDTIRTGELSPWLVWSAAGALAVLAAVGLYLGIHGGHPSDVGLTLVRGEALSPATAASATPAVAMPKDQQWSTLNGPAITPKSAAPPAAATAESDSDEEASAEPAAAVAADQTPPTPAPPTPPPMSSAAPQVDAPPPASLPGDGPTTP